MYGEVRGLLIVEPFNAVYLIFVGAVFALITVFTYFLCKKPPKVRKKAMIIFTSAVAVLLLAYKFTYRLDPEFIVDYPKYYPGEYTVWSELPLNPCNIVLLLFPVALWKENRYLLSFCVFMGIIGTSLALFMPQAGYAGYDVFRLHTFGFFLLHSTGVALPVSVCVLGLYRPRMGDVLRAAVVLAVTAAAAHLINVVLRSTGLCDFANYYFTMDTENNPVLEFCFRILPVRGIYTIGTLAIFCPASALITLLCRAAEKIAQKSKGAANI